MRLAPLLLAAFVATPALSEIVTVPATASVPKVMDALVAAVEGAGATVFARVDHGAGAEEVGTPIGASQLLIFGNPEMGTPAMMADAQAGLYLPLKVLVYEDGDEGTLLAYEAPADTFEGLGVDEEAEFLRAMDGALQRLTNKAAITME